jgi:hypothetical protein
VALVISLVILVSQDVPEKVRIKRDVVAPQKLTEGVAGPLLASIGQTHLKASIEGLLKALVIRECCVLKLSAASASSLN